MSEKQSKKLNKAARKAAWFNWFEYLDAIQQWPWQARLRFARDIIFKRGQRHRKKVRKINIENRKR